HTGGGNAFFAGEIAEARLYDRALTAEQVSISFKAGPRKGSPDDIVKALAADERRQREENLANLAHQRSALKVVEKSGETWAALSTKAEPTFVFLRGDVEKKGEQVAAGALSAIRAPSPEWGMSFEVPEGERRLRLAEWIAD